jgi:hypothetical protein
MHAVVVVAVEDDEIAMMDRTAESRAGTFWLQQPILWRTKKGHWIFTAWLGVKKKKDSPLEAHNCRPYIPCVY